jgi:hypothetical protein
VLYALWCLEDVERVDRLEARWQAAQQAMRLPITDGGARNLNDELQAVQREIRTPFGRGTSTGMPTEVLLTFPGMPNHRKPVS